jgi:hypothetical protein
MARRATPHRLHGLGEQAGVIARAEDVELLTSEVEDGEGHVLHGYADNDDGARGGDDVGRLADKGGYTRSFNHHRGAVTRGPALDRPFDRLVGHVDHAAGTEMGG